MAAVHHSQNNIAKSAVIRTKTGTVWSPTEPLSQSGQQEVNSLVLITGTVWSPTEQLSLNPQSAWTAKS